MSDLLKKINRNFYFQRVYIQISSGVISYLHGLKFILTILEISNGLINIWALSYHGKNRYNG